jgi:hypothetical protein
MPADLSFMAWVDHLPEVGDPIRRERAKLQELAEQVAELERHAAALRVQVRAGEVKLVLKASKHWTLADVQAATEAADRADRLALARAKVEDATLRACLQPLDGWHLATEALQAFEAGVIRQHNLLDAASDEERSQTLARVLAWWNLAGRPVCERLALK